MSLKNISSADEIIAKAHLATRVVWNFGKKDSIIFSHYLQLSERILSPNNDRSAILEDETTSNKKRIDSFRQIKRRQPQRSRRSSAEIMTRKEQALKIEDAIKVVCGTCDITIPNGFLTIKDGSVILSGNDLNIQAEIINALRKNHIMPDYKERKETHDAAPLPLTPHGR